MDEDGRSYSKNYKRADSLELIYSYKVVKYICKIMAFLNQANKIAGNSIESVSSNARAAAITLGRSALHTLAPDNFEYYMCSLELLNSAGETKGFMTFTVMPNNLVETKTAIASVTKTNRGLVTLFNDSFAPREISIQGTFGRKLRLLIGAKEAEEVSQIPFFGGNLGFNLMDSNVLIKTGYGLTKMMKSMVDKTYVLDDKGNPCVLIFKNYALNTKYVVEPLQSSFSQSLENNMIWYYNLELKAVAPAEAVKRKTDDSNKSFFRTVASNAIANGLGNILKDVSRVSIF